MTDISLDKLRLLHLCSVGVAAKVRIKTADFGELIARAERLERAESVLRACENLPGGKIASQYFEDTAP